MEDIEDMFKTADDQIEARLPATKRKIIPKKAKKNGVVNGQKNGDVNGQQNIAVNGQNGSMMEKGDKAKSCACDETEASTSNGHAPGSQSVFVKTYGCSHNISDSEYMAGLLADYGFKIVEDMDKADACLLNSCTVKNPSQEKFINLVQKAQNQGKPVIVSGCVPQGDRGLKGLENVSVLGVTQIDRVVEVVEESLKGHQVKLLAKKDLPILDLPKIRKNSLIEIIPLSTGCLGSCTYCKTRHARGKLGSYDPQAIVDRAKSAIDEGVMEIWLTSEDTGAYGRDIDTDLPTLLKSIIKIMPNHTMLRLGMTNPPFILEHLQAMADILNHPRVYQFLHVPVQTGSNPVLDKMNREYTVEEFNEVCDYLQARVPNMIIATDIICGFPTETEEHHKETCDLVRKYKFPVLNISQFYPRPGTVAAKWKKVPSAEVKKRSGDVTKIFNSYNTNDVFLNTEQLVWIIGFDDRKIKNENNEDKKQLMGHTKTYTKVVLDQDPKILGTDQPAIALVGKCVKILVTQTHKWHISGHVIDACPPPVVVPEDYFEKLDKERKEKLRIELQQDLAAQKKKELLAAAGKSIDDSELNQISVGQSTERPCECDIKEARPEKLYTIHLIGMLTVSVGVFLMLQSLF